MRNRVCKLRPDSEKGGTIIEALVAIAIIILVIAGPYATHTSFVAVTHANTERIKANFLAEEGIEAIKTIRNRGWTNISDLSSDTSYALQFTDGEWIVADSVPAIDGIFARTFTVEPVYRDDDDNIVTSGGTADPGTRKLTVLVTWTSNGNVTTKQITTYIADIL